MEKETENFYLDLCDKALVNAEEFLRNAELLYERESYGQAYSLAVLGFEELAKTWGGFNLIIGVCLYTDKEIRELFYKHEAKHILNWNQIKIIFNIFWFELFEKTEYKDRFLEKTSGNKITADEIEDQFEKTLIHMSQDKDEEIRTAAVNVLKLREIIEEFEKNPKVMDEKKQGGFYVKVKFKTKEIETPQEFAKNKDFLDTVKWFLNLTKNFLEVFKLNLHEEQFARQIKSMRDAMQWAREFDMARNKSQQT